MNISDLDANFKIETAIEKGASAILINEESVNIVVRVKDGLNQEKVSQIQNIISRELSVEIENIHISEK